MPTISPESDKKPPIDVAEAAQSAMRYATRILPAAGQFTLEEVELSEDGKFWMITLGYARPKIIPAEPPAPWASNIFGPLEPRHEIDYKVFKVDARTGEVVAMKLRPVE